ncbi:SbcC/MukB-like Walker B domain-containing protein [Liquorilactobacillus sucicola]|uniref:SbcC/MukB-like Walker B domain-containing protein n=1 Tax=Liquorilactobacillus sucicola TaxID=519050 RepID=UPI000555E898|nr:SbcC/MukB-like Walker B domain-containing protein [Liquorilactobacillus sucicola]
MKSGTPCPVCGSRTHPAPVKIEKVREVTEEKVKEAEVNSKNTASVYHSYKGEYQAKKDQYDTEKSSYQEQYKKFAERIMGTIVTNDLTSLKLKLDQQAKELLQKKKDLEAKEFEAAEAAKKIRLLQNERKQLQKKIEAKENNIRKVAIELAQAETTVKRLNEQLPIGFDTLEELQGLLKKQQKRITVYDAKVDKLQKEVEQTVLAITACKIEIKNCQEQLIDEEKNKYQLVAKVQLAAKNCNFEVNELFIQEQLKELPKTAEYQTEIKKHEEKLLTIKTKIDQLAEHTKNAEEPQLEEIRKELTVARSKREEVADEVARYKQIYQSDEKICEQVASLWSDQQKKLEELASWNQLAEVMNGKGNLKLSLERYVLRSYLTKVLLIANDHLTRLSQGRYAFKLDKNNGTHATDTGLEINVFDDNTGKVRSVHTLSGGESFIAALALSLALGEVLQSINGGSSIEALFIDEGFGSLDEDALETALEALQTIEGTNRLFGIISHVGALRDKIPDQMQVLSNNGHSTVAYQHEF